jgi:hypothetical protein
MSSRITRTQAFRRLGARPRSLFLAWWSARSPDDRLVAVTLWLHEFAGPAGKMVYERLEFGDWQEGACSRAFFEDLAWAVAHCGGIVSVVISVRDWSALPLIRTAECYPAPNVQMRVVSFDSTKGAFKLEQVDAKALARAA